MKWSKVDISLNHDVMASITPTSDLEFPNLLPTWPVYRHKGAPICPWDSISVAQTVCFYLIYVCMKQSEVDISLKHDIMASFSLHKKKWLRIPKFPKILNNFGQWNCMGAPTWLCDSIQVAQTPWICLIWMYEMVWGGYQLQSWHYGIIYTPQATPNSQIWGQLGQCNITRVHPYALETAYQWLKRCIYLIWIYEAFRCDEYQPQPWRNDIIPTP